jgi:hypothetical protein
MIIFLLLALGLEPQEYPHWAKEAFAGESGYVEQVKVKKPKVKSYYVKQSWKKSVFEPQD